MDTSNNDEIFEANDPIVEPNDYLLPDGSRATPSEVYEAYKCLPSNGADIILDASIILLTNNGDKDGFDQGTEDSLDIMYGLKSESYPMPLDPAPDMDLSELISSLKAGYSPENQPTLEDFQKIYEKAYFYGYYEASLK